MFCLKVWWCVKMIFFRVLLIYWEYLLVINFSMMVFYEEGGFLCVLILVVFDILMRLWFLLFGVWIKVCLCDVLWVVDIKLKEIIIKLFLVIKILEKFNSFWIFLLIRLMEY